MHLWSLWRLVLNSNASLTLRKRLAAANGGVQHRQCWPRSGVPGQHVSAALAGCSCRTQSQRVWSRRTRETVQPGSSFWAGAKEEKSRYLSSVPGTCEDCSQVPEAPTQQKEEP